MVGTTQHKLALYADNLLLYFTNPLVSLPTFLREFERFDHLCNFKVNYYKMEALNITYDESMVKHLAEVFPFKWQDLSLKYLGTHITKFFDNLYKLNFLPILNHTLTDLQNYGAQHLSWFGRIKAIKMDVLPCCSPFGKIFLTCAIILLALMSPCLLHQASSLCFRDQLRPSKKGSSSTS